MGRDAEGGPGGERRHLRLHAGRVREVRPPRQGPASLRDNEGGGPPQEHHPVRDADQGLRQVQGPAGGARPLSRDAGPGGGVQRRRLQQPHRRLRPRERPAGRRGGAAADDRVRRAAGSHHVQHPHQGLLQQRRAQQGHAARRGAVGPRARERRDCVQLAARGLREGGGPPVGLAPLHRDASEVRAAQQRHLLHPREAPLARRAPGPRLPPRLARDARDARRRAHAHGLVLPRDVRGESAGRPPRRHRARPPGSRGRRRRRRPRLDVRHGRGGVPGAGRGADGALPV
mmetsp:Transcript_6686/g.17980  ORF Transcript_6686/g.17980 Transcript_6686/m.17980 type:complete len:287 (+) Transcript_6686:360-1220(+)